MSKKKLIKQLAEQSYKGKNLDEGKVKKIAGKLNKEDLRVYIKDLKNLENRKTVRITIADEAIVPEIKKRFEKIYPDKKIFIEVDPELMVGIRVVDYDNIYELSLQESLETMINSVSRND
jgi:F0F1-type ATP synthase delta subunit